MVFFKNQNGTLVSATAKEQRVVLRLVFKVKGHFFGCPKPCGWWPGRHCHLVSEQNAINASVEKYRQETGPQFSRNEKLRRQLNHNISSGRESLLSEESVQYSMRGGI